MSGRSRSHLKKQAGDASSDSSRRKAKERRQRFDWSRISVPDKPDFVDYVHDKTVNFEDPDVRVVAGDLEFNCHSVVLRSYSGFFRESTAPAVVLPPAAASSAAFSAIYDWMLASGEDASSVLNRDNIVDVLASARCLRVADLTRLCETLLADEALFDEYAAFRVMVEAGARGGLEDVRDAMLPRIRSCFLRLVATDDFTCFSADEMCRLLSSDHIAVHGELEELQPEASWQPPYCHTSMKFSSGELWTALKIEVLFAGVLWLLADWEARRSHLLAVMRCVRFGLVPAKHLLALRQVYRQPELRELVSHRDVQELLTDGLSYSALHSSTQLGDQASVEEMARQLGCQPQQPRPSLPAGCCPSSFREFSEAVDHARPSAAFQRLQRRSREMPLYLRPAGLPTDTAGSFVHSNVAPAPAGTSPRQAGGDYSEDSAGGIAVRRHSSTASCNLTGVLTSGTSAPGTDTFSSTTSLLTVNASTQTPFPLLDDDCDDAASPRGRF